MFTSKKVLPNTDRSFSPPEYNRPEPGINPCKGSDFSLSREETQCFFVPLAIDKNIPDDPLQRDSPESAADGRGPAAFLHRQRLYFAPQFRGEVLPQHDVQQYEGMAKEIWDNRAQTGEDPQWAGADVRRHAGLPDQRGLTRHNWSKNTAGQIVKIINTLQPSSSSPWFPCG